VPSRRVVLAAAAGLATVGSVASSGCLTALGAAETGFLSYKGIRVEWERRGRRASADLCWVWFDGRERVFGWVNEGYAAVVVAPADVRASAAVDAALRREFLDVTYELGFSRPGSDHDLLGGDWYVARASRADFNDCGSAESPSSSASEHRERAVGRGGARSAHHTTI
jgi:hypothetical protein